METISEKRNQVLQEIIEFYKIQPGVSSEILEKLEEYLLLMNSITIEALNDLEELSSYQVNLTDTIDVLNTFINSIIEESEKIFPNEDIEILPLKYTDEMALNELQVLEYLKNLNQADLNRFKLMDALHELDEKLYDDEFPDLIMELVEKLILAINSERIVKVEDLM
ncbi:hypothetical protein [Marinifilum flexuosum]|uniref:Uncharacterized protein n=1 Tax=Marinifilum flexuosum TaxID=1117708 RepID=A0A419WSX0_9BACT|nr:hypothetical protein [Marinifilum flexuosum]RKD98532.1 hypothetical protein BXY64_3391 [Marinifilum flexuosum]